MLDVELEYVVLASTSTRNRINATMTGNRITDFTVTDDDDGSGNLTC